MAGKWKYYNQEAYNSKKREQKDHRCPPRANFLAAVSYIKTLLDGKNINWAALCGLAMLGLGSNRLMPDVHVVFDGGAFEKIRAYLEKDSRTRIPKGMNSLFPAKVLVGTGPSHKDSGCMEEADVEVNLIPSGSNGTPPNDILRKHQIVLQLPTESNTMTFKGLDMLYLVRTTLYYSKSLDLSWDPRKDLVFLCERHPNEVASIRHQLIREDLYECLFRRSFFSVTLPPELQHICSQALLGLDRPPSPKKSPVPSGFSETSNSAKSPPPQAGSVALNLPLPTTEDPARPALKSHNSSPLLSGAFHKQPRTSNFRPGPIAATQPHKSSSSTSQPENQPNLIVPQTKRNYMEPQPTVVADRYYDIALSTNKAHSHSRHSSQEFGTQPKQSTILLPHPNNGSNQDRLRRPASFHSGLNQVSETYRSLLPQAAPEPVVPGSHNEPSSTTPDPHTNTIPLQPSSQQQHPFARVKSEYIAYTPKDRRTTLPAPTQHHSRDTADDKSPSSSAANSPRSKAQQSPALSRSPRMSVPLLTDLPPSLLPGGRLHKRTTSNTHIVQETQIYELPASKTPNIPEPDTKHGEAETGRMSNLIKDSFREQAQTVASQRRYTAYQPSGQPYHSPSLDFAAANNLAHGHESDHLSLAEPVAGLKLSDVEVLTVDPSHEEEEEEDFT